MTYFRDFVNLQVLRHGKYPNVLTRRSNLLLFIMVGQYCLKIELTYAAAFLFRPSTACIIEVLN